MATFINPFTDFGFKKIFGQEASKPHLIDFLNSLLPDFAQIQDLSFKNLEQLPSIENERKAVYDIYCQGKNGEYFIVELQKLKQDFFKDRTLYYATFPIQQQAQKGQWDYQLTPVYCVGILGFTFDDDKANAKEVVHTVKFKDQNNQVFYDKLTFIYLEMPNFNKTLEESKTRREKWLYFIKNLEDLQSIPAMLADEVFSSAFETAKLSNLDEASREQYEYSLKVIRDNYSTLETALREATEAASKVAREVGREEGFLEGEAKGREAGMLEGEAKGREAGVLEEKARADQKLLEVARNLKIAGLTQDQIQTATGLSTELLEQNKI